MIYKEKFTEIINKICDEIINNKELLNDLDRAIGDSDHGSNMMRGFSECKNKINQVQEIEISNVLKTIGMTLISSVGGASGPLYGTAFLKASTAINGKDKLDSEDIINVYESIIDGIKHRGKAEKGHKTMLDAIIPAYEAFKESVQIGNSIEASFILSKEAALVGVENTKNIIAIKGRASFLGDRSIGHQDPGATSSYIIIKTISDEINKSS